MVCTGHGVVTVTIVWNVGHLQLLRRATQIDPVIPAQFEGLLSIVLLKEFHWLLRHPW